MKIAVTGAAGQLGIDVVAAARSAGHELAALDRSALDIVDAAAVDALLLSFAPDVVVNCAAYTAVDACETDHEGAHAVNEHGVRNLARSCRSQGAHLIHVSTDYVFGGDLDRPYREDDSPSPRSAYGRSKLAGEQAAVAELGEDVTIVRTSWVCGEHGNNMVKLVRRMAGDSSPMAFVDDQRGNPTFTADLAPALLTLAHERHGGVFHLTNGGDVSWYEFVREILAASGFDPEMVRPISTAELDPPRPAPRPANSVLDNARWSATGHSSVRHHREALEDLVERLDRMV